MVFDEFCKGAPSHKRELHVISPSDGLESISLARGQGDGEAIFGHSPMRWFPWHIVAHQFADKCIIILQYGAINLGSQGTALALDDASLSLLSTITLQLRSTCGTDY